MQVMCGVLPQLPTNMQRCCVGIISYCVHSLLVRKSGDLSARGHHTAAGWSVLKQADNESSVYIAIRQVHLSLTW